MRVIAIVVAAGSGVRALGGAGDGLPKQHRPIAGASALTRSLALCLGHPRIAAVLPVIRAGDPADASRAELAGAAALARSGAEARRLLPAVEGGPERQASVRNAVEALARAPEPPDAVLVHDAARPFTPRPALDRVLDALAAGAEAVCPALAVVDTLRRTDPEGAAGPLVPRDGLVRAQTPQGFRFAPLLAAHRSAGAEPATDDAELARRAGLRVVIVEGAEAAFKITTPQDFARAEAQAALEAAAMERRFEYRIGTGFDVHAFGANADGSRDHAWLCGVAVPHTDGLKGHSDADVGLHALTDAVLGALADGDIGAHFPPSEARWRGAASDRFLAFAAERVRARGGRIAHLDVTLICEQPKIRPHVEAMRRRIAEIVGVAAERVSVKATTTEQLGFTGRREGIAALASATVALPERWDDAEPAGDRA